MKPIVLLAGGLLLSAAAFAQKPKVLPFTIKGTIEDVNEPANVIFQYVKEGKMRSDTVALVKGGFAFRGAVAKPSKGFLSVLKASDKPMMMAMGYDGELMGRDARTVYLDKGTITVKGSTLKTAVVSGSAAHNDYRALQKELKPVHEKLNAINEEMAKLSAEERKGEAQDKLMSRLMEAFKDIKPIEEAFVKSHPNSYVSWNLVAGKTIIDDPQGHKALFDLLPQKFRNSEEGKQVLEKINTAFKTAIGQPAPEFTQNNTEEKPVTLASLKGKYVLIDFWASWCGPCRAENPHVVKAYNKFKDKNFEILAVSLDNKKEPWLEAIKKDGLPWLHVSDLKGWKNEVAVLYNVQAVPQNWLIDPNGIIIAKNMRGEDLSKKLEELVK